MRARL